eukprot:TRINITY_DN2096_c0_g2_i3.p1 TRINITY_DN2096_c0_g2~~TRINITY_DN2096_c0_g2_i3.p1  ORF type:complete len:427 (+),score=71.22 TRINITY_DN2096_c0_g2_i3:173-1453(+)
MGKKKNSSRNKRQQSASEAWEVDSVVSTSTDLSGALVGEGHDAGDEDTSADVFFDLIEALYEKRSSTRTTALKQLLTLLSQAVQAEECEERIQDLLPRILNCIMKGGSEEVLLAAKVIGFLSVTLGMSDENELLVKQALIPFKKIIKQSSKSAQCQSIIQDTIALTCFVAIDENEIVQDCLKILESQFNSDEPQILISALRGWSLIVSNLSFEDINMKRIEDSLFGEISHMLQLKNVDIRGAAGEALAVINHRFGQVDLDEFLDGNDEDWDSQTMDSASMSSTVADAMEGVKDRMRDLVKNRGEQQRRSKKDRASQRSQFRELLELVESGAVKREELKLRHGDRLVVEGLEEKIQLNAFRRYLGSALQEHVQNNELLHNIFDFKPIQQKTEKRVFTSAYGKAKTVKRKSDRKRASEMKGGYDFDDY